MWIDREEDNLIVYTTVMARLGRIDQRGKGEKGVRRKVVPSLTYTSDKALAAMDSPTAQV